MAVSIVFTVLATGFVVARLYTRIKLMRRVESNDWMVIIALVSWNTHWKISKAEEVKGQLVHFHGTGYCRGH